jgi:hypothetical protein
MRVAVTMNTIWVIENPMKKHSHNSEPSPMGAALEIPCVCGAHIYPMVGAWCQQCGAKVVQIREFH